MNSPVCKPWSASTRAGRWLPAKLLKRGSFKSVEDLQTNVLAFIDSDNLTAKPFKWTDQGKALTI